MSFIWFANKPLKTKTQIALEVHQVSIARGLDKLATVLALMCIDQEVGAEDKKGERQWWCPWNDADPQTKQFPYDSQSDDGLSSGYFQQQVSRPGAPGRPWGWGGLFGDIEGVKKRMTLSLSADLFLAALSDDYVTVTNPAQADDFIQRVQKSAFPGRYADGWDMCWDILNKALAEKPEEKPDNGGGTTVPVDTNKPDFNEFAIWSPSNQGRNGVKIDSIFIHTQEGGGGNSAAEDLANYLANPANKVSYHYTGSQASDGGKTVVDCVDTDRASWSVLSANNRSINYCFAGSRASDSRATWMKRSGIIDVFAYLIVQDCKKYNIPIKVIKPVYNGNDVTYKDRIPGISDHRYVTEVLDDGSHTDVGPNFPWDYFEERIKFWAGEKPADPTNPTVPTPDYVKETWDQLRVLWPMLGNRTAIEALGAIGEKLGIEGMYDVKTGPKK